MGMPTLWDMVARQSTAKSATMANMQETKYAMVDTGRPVDAKKLPEWDPVFFWAREPILAKSSVLAGIAPTVLTALTGRTDRTSQHASVPRDG